MLADAVLGPAADLLLGSSCAACAAPGRVLGPRCRADLPRWAVPAWPTPTPAGLAPPWAAAAYDGIVRALLLAHKERRVWGLGAPLGRLLALAAGSAAGPGPAPLVLVPVPSRAGVTRQRGHDPTAALTRAAARTLRAEGYDVRVARLVALRGAVADQAGLDAAARGANLAGSMACPAPGLARLHAWRPRARVVVCDDVITTGATAREAQRALEASGVSVRAVAAVAATTRRHPPTGSRLSSRPGSD